MSDVGFGLTGVALLAYILARYGNIFRAWNVERRSMPFDKRAKLLILCGF